MQLLKMKTIIIFIINENIIAILKIIIKIYKILINN